MNVILYKTLQKLSLASEQLNPRLLQIKKITLQKLEINLLALSAATAAALALTREQLEK